MTPPAAAPATQPSTKIRSASTLLWVAGILQILIGIAVGWPQVAQGKGLPLLILVLPLLGLVFCTAGAMLRKRRKLGGILAIGSLSTALLLHILNRTIVSGGAALTALTLLLVVTAWGELT